MVIRFLGRLLVLAVTFAAIVAVFLWFVRPWYLDWGATAAERTRVLPGDEIIPHAASQQTRALTIDAPAEAVWPWLAQVGQDRGGFYSFDLLENLVGCEMPTRDVLRPGKQSWSPGDKLWMYPQEKAGGAGFATVHVFVPGRVLGFGVRMLGVGLDQPETGSWTWVLEPIGADRTRLLIRGRGEVRPSLLGVAFDRGFFEPVHFVMERRMMIGLREVVETGARARRLNNVHIVLWVIVAALALVAAFRVVTRRHWARPLAAFVVAAAVFQILTLRQPPLLIGALLLAATAWVLRRPSTPAREDVVHDHAAVA